jgi:hypothetical protein
MRFSKVVKVQMINGRPWSLMKFFWGSFIASTMGLRNERQLMIVS